MRIARQARSEKSKKLFQIFSRQGVNEILVASMARWKEHLGMLVVLERECLAFREEVEHLNEKQEVLTVLMEGKMSMQKVAPEKYQEKIFEELKELEEQQTREALELVQRKHKLVTSEGERERARMLQGMELSGAVGHFSEGFVWTIPPLVLAHPPWHLTQMKRCPLLPRWH